MKYSIKPNQSKIFQTEIVKYKDISVIKINSEDKTIELVSMKNGLSSIQKALDIYEYEKISLEKNSMEHFIVGVDDDLKTRRSFSFKGNTQQYYGNAVLVKIPKSYDMEKLQSTKTTVEQVRNVIIFND